MNIVNEESKTKKTKEEEKRVSVSVGVDVATFMCVCACLFCTSPSQKANYKSKAKNNKTDRFANIRRKLAVFLNTRI